MGDAIKKILYIPDTSVLLKWAIPESEEKLEALAFRQDFYSGNIEAFIPNYCFAEIANILGRHYNRLTAQSYLSYFLMLPLEEIEITMNVASWAFMLMNKFHGISFYDAYYHACAMFLQGTFLTADEKYYKQTHRQGHIMLLKDYGKKK